MPRRIVRRPSAITDRLPQGLHPLVRRVYLGRGVSDAEALDLSLSRLAPPTSLGNVASAVQLMSRAIARNELIVIIGDYDADGATSTALAVRGLRAMGARRVDFLLPNRFTDGYGLTPALVERAAGQGAGLIVTVDNGVASVAGVMRSAELGIPVIVTDHHLPGPTLPATVIVNPNLAGDPFPSKNLAGVGVIFYVLVELRRALRETGWFQERGLPDPNLADMLDLVALGTVADMVPLDHNNRILVEHGLRRIRGRRSSLGVLALIEASGRDPDSFTAQDLAFAVAPRLNSAGRLSDMTLGVRCLLSEDASEANLLASRLDELNRERRQIETEMRVSAETLLEGVSLSEDDLPAGLCLFDPSWHQGVIGILAARLVRRYHRPVIAFAAGGAGELKGSARSVPGVHIKDALEVLAEQDGSLIRRFGGHAMAAGLSVDPHRFERFTEAFSLEISRRMAKIDATDVLYTDGAVGPAEWTLETALALRHAGPWGQGFPEPLFDGEFRILERRFVGDGHLKLRVSPADADIRIDAIAFRGSVESEDLASTAERQHLAFQLDVNRFQETERLQLIVADLQTPAERENVA